MSDREESTMRIAGKARRTAAGVLAAGALSTALAADATTPALADSNSGGWGWFYSGTNYSGDQYGYFTGWTGGRWLPFAANSVINYSGADLCTSSPGNGASGSS